MKFEHNVATVCMHIYVKVNEYTSWGQNKEILSILKVLSKFLANISWVALAILGNEKHMSTPRFSSKNFHEDS